MADALLYCILIFSEVFDECRIYELYLTFCVEILTDDPQ